MLDRGINIPNLEDHDQSNVGGLTDEQIDTFPVEIYKNKNYANEENKKCTICMEEFVENEKVKFLGCFHVFHAKEIKIWLKKNPFCPICKYDTRK